MIDVAPPGIVHAPQKVRQDFFQQKRDQAAALAAKPPPEGGTAPELVKQSFADRVNQALMDVLKQNGIVARQRAENYVTNVMHISKDHADFSTYVDAQTELEITGEEERRKNAKAFAEQGVNPDNVIQAARALGDASMVHEAEMGAVFKIGETTQWTKDEWFASIPGKVQEAIMKDEKADPKKIAKKLEDMFWKHAVYDEKVARAHPDYQKNHPDAAKAAGEQTLTAEQQEQMEETALMEHAYGILTSNAELFESDKYELAEDTRCMWAELALARHLSESVLGNTGIIQLYRRSVLRNYKEYLDKHPAKGKKPEESFMAEDGTSLYTKLGEVAGKAVPDTQAAEAASRYIQAKFQTKNVPWNDQIGAVIAEGNMSELMATLYSVDMIPNADPKLKAKLRKGLLKGSKLLNDRKLDKYFDEQPAAIGLMVDTTFGESTTEARQTMEKELHDLAHLFQKTEKGGVIAAIRNGVRNFGGVFAMAITSSLKVLDEGVEPAQSAPQGHGG